VNSVYGKTRVKSDLTRSRDATIDISERIYIDLRARRRRSVLLSSLQSRVCSASIDNKVKHLL
jgi:hypothetical protein